MGMQVLRMTSGIGQSRACVLALFLMGVSSVLGMASDITCIAESSPPRKRILPFNHKIGMENTPDDGKEGSLFASDTQPIISNPQEETRPEGHLAIQNNARTSNTPEKTEVEACRSAMSRMVIRSENEFFDFQMLFPENGQPFKPNIAGLESAANYLYERKLAEIVKGRPLLLRGGGVTLPPELGGSIDLRLIKDCLAPFEKVVETSVSQAHVENVEVKLMMSHWSDLMIHFFHDLKNFQLVPEDILSQFLREDQGRLFWSFIIAKYPPFDVASTYLNFELRLSIAKDRHIQNTDLKRIFQAFDEETWKQLEFQLLKARLTHKATQVSSKAFDRIREDFLRIALPNKATSVAQIKTLLGDLVAYIPKVMVGENQPEKILVHLKLLYDMVKFLHRYHPEVVSNELKESAITFHQLRAFEESVGLISTLNHFLYEQSYLFFLNLKEEPKDISLWNRFKKWVLNDQTNYQAVKLPAQLKEKLKGSSYLTDSNPDRRVDVDIDSEGLQELERSPEYVNFYSQFPKEMIFDFVKGGSLSAVSLQRCEDQYLRYLFQLKKLKELEDSSITNNYGDFSKFIEHLELMGMANFRTSQQALREQIEKYSDAFNLGPTQKLYLTSPVQFVNGH
ncbi:hypothetical protein PGTUg99_021668 [Puccinia graminis f. sp. tritici]|uniref:Uncharacterized protein n=1 Tax=Puccinia graminis f. sp. tritici TaxID=56615 RepID=A0A5B0RFC3_PUCGR|nr:hypothetical protein PGTUg99_021668 [Puccinia graminis f. sp. tritici]